jgi:hypothetical protein
MLTILVVDQLTLTHNILVVAAAVLVVEVILLMAQVVVAVLVDLEWLLKNLLLDIYPHQLYPKNIGK